MADGRWKKYPDEKPENFPFYYYVIMRCGDTDTYYLAQMKWDELPKSEKSDKTVYGWLAHKEPYMWFDIDLPRPELESKAELIWSI